MTTTVNQPHLTGPKGLEGIVAGQTAICYIDGIQGRLFYRGINIDELAQRSSFEETTALLWYGKLPNQRQLESFKRKLTNHRQLPNELLAVLLTLSKQTPPMDVLRTAVSALAVYDPAGPSNTPDANFQKSLYLTSSLPTIVAAWFRIRNGLWPITPSTELSHAGNFLYMLTGKEPTEAAAQALDTALILQADHSLNASTFAARVTASTLSDIYSAIVSAIGTLKGPLHGGASEEVMNTLDQIGGPEKVDTFVEDKFARKEKFMGFGHRVYKNEDPRTPWLAQLYKRLSEEQGDTRLYETSERLRTQVQARKPLPVNVDFYSAPLYHMLGLPTDLYISIFAIARIAGWTAHVYEQYADNRLIRPEAEYVGKMDVPYVPVEQRS